MATVQETGTSGFLDPEIKIEEEEDSVGPKAEEVKEGAAVPKMGSGGGDAGQRVKQEPEEEPSMTWDAQFKEFLRTLQSPPSAQETAQQPDPQVLQVPPLEITEVRKWPRGLGGSPNQPHLIGRATADAESHWDATCSGKGKEGMPGKNVVGLEMQRQHFRTLSYREAEGPRKLCRQLRELCRMWLVPERHTKEQMLDLVTLEQFLAVLPLDMQNWLRERGPETCDQAVSLAEDFVLKPQGTKCWEGQTKGAVLSSQDLSKAIGDGRTWRSLIPRITITRLSKEELVNIQKAKMAQPNMTKAKLLTETAQRQNGIEHLLAGSAGLTENEEQKPLLESTGEMEQLVVSMKMGKEKNFLCQGESDKNQQRAEKDNAKIKEKAKDPFVSSQGVCKSISDPPIQDNEVKFDKSGEHFSQNSQFIACEGPDVEEKPYKCWHCGQSFSSSSNLLTHERTHVGEKLYKCSYCGESERIHKGQKPHRCSRCGNTFGCNAEDKIQAGEKPYTNSERGKSCSQRSDLLKHQRTHTGGEGQAASEEQKVLLETTKEMDQPMTSVETGKEDNFLCQGESAKNQQRADKDSGNSEEKVEDLFLPPQGVCQSISDPTIQDKENEVKYEKSGKRFSQNSQLSMHEGPDVEEKPYKCWHCGQSFSGSSNLLTHERTHVGEKLYKCSHCGESVRTRTGQEPHRCSQCGNTFGCNAEDKFQAGEKPYTSSEHGKSCSQRSDLLKHQRTHTGGAGLTENEERKALLRSMEEMDQLMISMETGKENNFVSREEPVRNQDRADKDNGNNKEKVEDPFVSSQAVCKSIHNPPIQDEENKVKYDKSGKHFSQNSQLSMREGPDVEEKPYKCWHCGQSFSSSSNLLTHERTHVGEKLYKCSYCGESERIHKGQKPHRCSHCGNTFGCNAEDKIQTREKPYTSSERGKSYHQRSDLLKHQRTHTREKPYKCSVCGKNFRNGSYLKVHQRIHTGETPYKCLHCGRCFTWSSHLRYHERMHTATCSYCGKSFNQKSECAQHEKTHAAEDSFVCFACGKVFDVSSELVAHVQTHKEKSFACSVCGKTFRNSLQRIAHQKVHTGEKQHKCSVCGKKFRNASYLKVHQRIHTGETPYTCLHCGRSFTWSSHLRYHEKSPIAVCSYCGKRFCQKSECAQHEKTHTGEKPYKCSHCDKTFRWSSHLVLHERIHTVEKPYRCSDCGRTFEKRSNLLVHSRIHTGQKPYICTDCGKSFTSYSVILRHQKIHVLALEILNSS